MADISISSTASRFPAARMRQLIHAADTLRHASVILSLLMLNTLCSILLS
jgi:hypothetical protein